MKKILITISLFIFVLSACRKNDSPSGLNIFNPDKKNEAAKIIEAANEDLKKVRVIYKKNQNRVDDELIPAMTAKDVQKAKDIAKDLVDQINEGLLSADEAVKKIKDAEALDINDTYKEYLRLKRGALELQIEAFELRKQVALAMMKNLGSSDTARVTQAQSEFKEKEIQFHDLMERGKGLSEEANQVFKDSLKEANNG